jgi:UDP-N-acetylmuramoyl-tripeptide--D-alanyl-D-alanine ligase
MEINELYKIYLTHPIICTDTRKIIKNSIYFALKGDNFNGNLFAMQAIEQGCAFAIVDEETTGKSNFIIKVDNVLETLQALANHHRKNLSIPIIAITGSNGKTTNKELIHAVLSKKYKTLATKGNLNNHIGVPLTLLNIDKECEIAIVEMGANHQKEIELLCKIAEPDFGLITNIGKAHLEGFGGLEGVKKGKKELYDFIKAKNGTIFINDDDTVLLSLAAGMNKISFGKNPQNYVSGSIESSSHFLNFKWKHKLNDSLVLTHLIGDYNFQNMLAAATIGCYFGVGEVAISSALSDYMPDNNRSQALKTEKNSLIMDAYNANPSSMNAALSNFYKLEAKNKLFILGDMLEMGDESFAEHKAIIELTKKLLLNGIFVGKEFAKVGDKTIAVFENVTEAKLYLQSKNIEHNTILIKGSRGIKLELVKDVL